MLPITHFNFPNVSPQSFQSNPIQTLCHFFKTQFLIDTQHTWMRFKAHWQSHSAEMVQKVKLIEDSLEWGTKKNLLLNLIDSFDFFFIKSRLKEIVDTLPPQHIDDLLKSCALNDSCFQRCIELLSMNRIELTLKHLYNDFESHQITLSKLSAIAKRIVKHGLSAEHYLKEEIQNITSYLAWILQSIVTTVLKATHVLELNREPESYYEASNMLNIYYKLISIPLLILAAMITFFESAIIGGVIAAGTALITLVAFFVYIKWINPVPNTLTKMENLTNDCKQGLIPPVIARDDEIYAVLDQLLARSQGAREFPLIIGPTGIGKSEIINGVALALLRSDLQEKYASLKKLTVFYANAAWLKDKGFNFSDLTTFQKITKKVASHKQEILVICDEIASLLDQDNANALKTNLDANRPQGLSFFLGATTRDEYKKFIQPDAAIDARFAKIEINEVSKEQLIEILKHMAQKHAPDLNIDEEVFGYIYDTCKAFKVKGAQPTSGMNLLSKAFNKMNEILLNTEAEKLLSQLKKELAQKERTVHSQDFEGDRIHHNLPPLFSDLELLEQRIAELETQRIVRKTDFEYYSRLKRTLTFCEVEENKGVRQIDKAAPGLANEESKKRVLLMHYYQLPALRKEILDFGKTKKFDIKLTKGIIDQIARDLIKNESEENRQCQLKKTTPILRRSHSVPAF